MFENKYVLVFCTDIVLMDVLCCSKHNIPLWIVILKINNIFYLNFKTSVLKKNVNYTHDNMHVSEKILILMVCSLSIKKCLVFCTFDSK